MLSEGPRAERHLDFGSRARARLYRLEIEEALDQGAAVKIDFEGASATQSFIDELVGILIFQRGPDVLKSVKFHRCSSEVKSIIRFVAADRTSQYEARRKVAVREDVPMRSTLLGQQA